MRGSLVRDTPLPAQARELESRRAASRHLVDADGNKLEELLSGTVQYLIPGDEQFELKYSLRFGTW